MSHRDHGFMLSLVLASTGSLLMMDVTTYHLRCTLDGYKAGES